MYVSIARRLMLVQGGTVLPMRILPENDSIQPLIRGK
mgnify:CR=1 FL=1